MNSISNKNESFKINFFTICWPIMIKVKLDLLFLIIKLHSKFQTLANSSIHNENNRKLSMWPGFLLCEKYPQPTIHLSIKKKSKYDAYRCGSYLSNWNANKFLSWKHLGKDALFVQYYGKKYQVQWLVFFSLIHKKNKLQLLYTYTHLAVQFKKTCIT